MASLLLGVAGEAAGNALLGGGVSLLGATLTGAQIGGAIGALAGSAIDAAIAPGRRVTGPRISDINLQGSTEGAPIPRLYGRMRVAGQLIWASQFQETKSTTKAGGGKGFSQPVSETDYSYSISFAVGLCAGPATRLGRIWANGAPLDLSNLTVRFYAGDESQDPDPLIVETEGADNSPAYRGLCYIVFEDLPLAAYGNRIPQLQCEIIRVIGHDNPGSLENRLPGVALIPGAGEFVYATDTVSSDDGDGGTVALNVHGGTGAADITASLDELQAAAPQLGAVSLVVGWFGDDLNAASIQVRPGAEALVKTTYPDTWRVNGVARSDAHLVTQIDGRPAYGGTPSDASVVQAIQSLKARGLRVLFYPFLFMDVPPGNALTDPYTGAMGQGAFPWRGRITVSPAPGQPGSPDKTAAAASAAAHFFGNATAGDFSVSGTAISWTGGDDWGWRRMVLHYAQLCAAAGGVDAFLIGSELRGLTWLRSDATTYPAVAALKILAADVRAILGAGTKIGYAADWSEYNNHQTGDAPGAVLFHLDPLWSDAHIDFVGIDNYMPLADWRDGTAHADYDAANGPITIYDAAYLARNIQGGEDYDWYYVSAADRDAQTRTTISDGAGKPWVFRQKDLWNWWASAHYDRADGSESGSPTGWTPQGKPIWFTELGCPAIDKGANQPNVFFDPKSSESELPYYSSGNRDDLMQRRFLEAHFNFWTDSAHNPVSTVYGAPMLDASNIYVWCWDARPYPYFPALSAVWGDTANYTTGHWLNGRLGAVSLSDLVGSLCGDAGFTAYDATALDGIVTGYAVTDTMSPRDAIDPLSVSYFFDGVESGGMIRFVPRGQANALPLATDDLVLADGAPSFGYRFERAQETDLPQVSRITYIDGDQDYRQASVEARRLNGASSRVASSTLPLVMDQSMAVAVGQQLLMDAWVMRESAKLALPPSQIALDPTDEIALQAGGRAWRLRVTGIDDGAARAIDAVATDPSIYDRYAGPLRAPAIGQPVTQTGRALAVFLDLPLLTDQSVPWAPHVAAVAAPWPGQVLIWRSATSSSYTLDTALARSATIGVTTTDFYSGPAWRWDLVNTLRVRLTGTALTSADDLSVFAGANALAVQNADGDWEVLQFAQATLTAPSEYSLTRLLRGQAGTESAMRHPVVAGARVVLLDNSLAQIGLNQSEALTPFQYLWGPAGKPISDPAYQGASLTFGAVGLLPFAPCHLDFAWDASGDLTFSWIRRDRAPGCSGWTAYEVPMSEGTEAYDLEIMNGPSVVRTFSAIAATSQLYTVVQQMADFPSGLSNPLTINLYMRSTALYRGRRATESLYVR